MFDGTLPVGWAQENDTGMALPPYPEWVDGDHVWSAGNGYPMSRGWWCQYNEQYVLHIATSSEYEEGGRLMYRAFNRVGPCPWTRIDCPQDIEDLKCADIESLIMESIL